jgi:hypothetical protein
MSLSLDRSGEIADVDLSAADRFGSSHHEGDVHARLRRRVDLRAGIISVGGGAVN